jgi:hypothetical protein
MTEIFTSPDQACFLLAKAYLESNEIECRISNELLSSIAGGIPVDQCWPKLYVIDDSKVDLAKEKIKEFLEQTQRNTFPSFCPNCDSEEIDFYEKKNTLFYPTFICRKCGHRWQNVGSY